jgi:hypothetical protein
MVGYQDSLIDRRKYHLSLWTLSKNYGNLFTQKLAHAESFSQGPAINICKVRDIPMAS